MTQINPKTLPKLLRYDQDTGKLYWRARVVDRFNDGAYTAERCCKAWNTRHAGEEAFTATNAGGYLTGRIFGRPHLAHAVAWALHTGAWPRAMIDHIDGDGSNNRIANLREATNAENMRNRGGNKNTTSQYCGVSWHRQTSKWLARIMLFGKRTHLGSFTDEIEAAKAYDVAALKLHGNFARLNFPEGTDNGERR